MNAQILDAAKLKLMPHAAETAEAGEAEEDAAVMLEAIQTRERTLTHVFEKILEVRPPSHWGINE
jgi:DNA-directed RNA polymerase specialized sigma54-like protein